MAQAAQADSLPDKQPITISKKVVLLGATAVGKTSIFNRIHSNEYIEENVTTMAAYFRPKLIDFPDKNCKVKINLWDTAGQERFASLTRQYVQAAAGVMLIYDITDAASMNEAHEWFNRLKDQVDLNEIVIALVGNKSDDPERTEISKKDLLENAKKVGAHISLEVSAKTGHNVEKLFEEFGRELIKKDNTVQQRSTSMMLQRSDLKPQKSGGCCGGKKKDAKK